MLVIALAAISAFTGGLAWLLDTPTPRLGAPRAERFYLGFCATCHGADGRGSWRAALFLIRPGDLADGARDSRRRFLEQFQPFPVQLGPTPKRPP